MLARYYCGNPALRNEREEISMDPKKEQEYADEIPDEEEADTSYEPTYRDGSAQNECWAADE